MPVGASIGAAAIGGAASLAGGAMQKSATDKATQVQRQMYDQTRQDLAPYRTAGGQATNMLMGRLPELTAPINMTQDWLEQTPGYQFSLRQGLKTTQSGAAARGLGKSGAAVKGAANYATGLANQTYGDQFNRELAQRLQSYNQLMGASQLGSNAAAQTGQAATQAGQSIGSNTIQGGNALAGGLVGAGNALATGAGNYMGYNLASQMANRGMYAAPNMLTRGNY